MKDIIVEFSGWSRLSPSNVTFVNIGKHSEQPDTITGIQWQSLDAEDKDDYILECVISAQRDCDDGDYTHVGVFVES